jgi:hypothetical protein
MMSVEQSVEWTLAEKPAPLRFLAGLIFTLKMDAIDSFEMSAHIRTARRYIPKDSNIHNYPGENLESYKD